MYFEKYKSNGQWRWRLKAANHEIIASGESYWNETDCNHAINLVKGTTSVTPVKTLQTS
ncbi:YegP family protein [Parasphingorhabdus sp.]|uniref:YegP family protein n=1 Tax=Parasphingorhabdus sp. TaxID=2709688 RepID=UPI003A8DFD53